MHWRYIPEYCARASVRGRCPSRRRARPPARPNPRRHGRSAVRSSAPVGKNGGAAASLARTPVGGSGRERDAVGIATGAHAPRPSGRRGATTRRRGRGARARARDAHVAEALRPRAASGGRGAPPAHAARERGTPFGGARRPDSRGGRVSRGPSRNATRRAGRRHVERTGARRRKREGDGRVPARCSADDALGKRVRTPRHNFESGQPLQERSKRPADVGVARDRRNTRERRPRAEQRATKTEPSQA